MIGFSIKKTFFDIWDHLLGTMLLNIGYLVPSAGLLLTFSFLSSSSILLILGILGSCLVFSLYSLGVSGIVYSWTSYRGGGWSDFRASYISHLSHAFVHFLMTSVCIMCIFVAIPFYFSIGNAVGYILGMMMFWLAVIMLLSMQFYYPLAFHMEADGPFKTLKKCFLVSAGNPWYSIFLALKTLINAVLSVVTCTLIPGITGIKISEMVMTRLLMHRYDWLEKNPGCRIGDAPWDELLYDDRENEGHRTLKGMIFPWKD